MTDWLIPIGTLLLGALAGFFFRAREFQREQRLTVYGEFGAAFLDSAHAGSLLFGLHVAYGDSIYGENREKATDAWRTWEAAAKRFEEAMVRLRLIASGRVRTASIELEDFIASDVRAVPPFAPVSKPHEWGEAAKTGPAEVDRAATIMARDFADRASRDVTIWRGK